MEDILGIIYVIAWSVSIYPSLITNFRSKSSMGISTDFAILNVAGYGYLLLANILQLYCWVLPNESSSLSSSPSSTSSSSTPVERPHISGFDVLYTGHGFILNIIILSQVLWGSTLWNFQDTGTDPTETRTTRRTTRRMKPLYRAFFQLTLLIFTVLTLRFIYGVYLYGWDNSNTVIYCGYLSLLKISMSLVKYIPQIKYNYERNSMRGFSMVTVLLDSIGATALLTQLGLQIAREQRGKLLAAGVMSSSWSMSYLDMEVLKANFGKLGLCVETLLFNIVFLVQWGRLRRAESLLHKVAP